MVQETGSLDLSHITLRGGAPASRSAARRRWRLLNYGHTVLKAVTVTDNHSRRVLRRRGGQLGRMTISGSTITDNLVDLFTYGPARRRRDETTRGP